MEIITVAITLTTYIAIPTPAAAPNDAPVITSAREAIIEGILLIRPPVILSVIDGFCSTIPNIFLQSSAPRIKSATIEIILKLFAACLAVILPAF